MADQHSEFMSELIRRSAGHAPRLALEAARAKVREALARHSAAFPGSLEQRTADAEVDRALNQVRALAKQEPDDPDSHRPSNQMGDPIRPSHQMDDLIRAASRRTRIL